MGATATDGPFALPAAPAGPHQLIFKALGFSSLITSVVGQVAAQQLPPLALEASSSVIPEVLVTASCANDRTATAYTNLSRHDLAMQNFG